MSMLQHIIPAAALALVIVFQPEIRRGLGYLGRVQTFKFDLSLSNTESASVKRGIDQIIAAVRELSRTKTGALIVIEPPEGERDYLSPGTPVNADLSSTLLLTIFFPKSPLHDGAVVIRKDKIVAAGVILPMTDNPKLSYKYGTRHRAAIGLSETYDGLCIVDIRLEETESNIAPPAEACWLATIMPRILPIRLSISITRTLQKRNPRLLLPSSPSLAGANWRARARQSKPL